MTVRRRDTRTTEDRGPYGVNWLFTINNYTRADESAFADNTDKFKCAIFGREVGEGGTPHLQCALIWNSKKRRGAILDIWPRAAKVQAMVGTPYQNWTYCAKGQQSKTEWESAKQHGPTYGLNASVERFGPSPKRPKECTYAAAMDILENGTVHDAIQHVVKNAPRDYALHGENIRRNFTSLKRIVPHEHKWKPSDFNVPLQCLDKHLLIYGEPGCGKTHYALAHFKNPCWVKLAEDLRSLSPDHDGIVFDDMAFHSWEPEYVLCLLDLELPRSIRCRYVNASIPSGLPCIFTHNNPNPFVSELVPEIQKRAIMRRYTTFHVTQPLFVQQ